MGPGRDRRAVTGILLAHPRAFGSGELKSNGKFGCHKMTVLYLNQCYNEVCYKGIAYNIEKL